MCLTVHGYEGGTKNTLLKYFFGGRKAVSLKAMLTSVVEGFLVGLFVFFLMAFILQTFFLVVLGLSPASEIPQYSPLPGACLESQIHSE